MKHKYSERADLFDIEARNVFVKSKVTTSMIKYAHSINPYGVRNSMINNQICGSEFP